MLPQRTTFLIVGGGPTGLTCAIALAKQGCRDVVLVDAVLQGQNTSRALAIHAATLEALDTIGCADQVTQLGVKGKELGISVGTKTIISADFTSLTEYTRFPYALILPQNITERVLGEHLQDLGVSVFRPYRVVGMTANKSEENIIDVTFETGETMQTRYVIGADGARSIVRKISGIGFADPDGDALDENFTQLILADVVFSSPPTLPVSTSGVSGFATPSGFILLIRMPSDVVSGPSSEPTDRSPDAIVYRLGCNIPVKDGIPPPAPPTSYIQAALNKYGPSHLSSDPSVNPQPIHVSETIWSTRFRSHAAIADRFFVRFGSESAGTVSAEKPSGGVVFLVGDAAHIHSPAGGQGMNLGIRDAVGLGAVLAQHLASDESQADVDKVLRDYAAARHERAISIIRLVKRIQSVPSALQSRFISGIVYMAVLTLGSIPAIRRAIAWRLSGLGTR